MKNNIIEKAQKASVKAEIIERLISNIQSMIESEESDLSYYNDLADESYKNQMTTKIKLRIAVMEEIAESLIK